MSEVNNLRQQTRFTLNTPLGTRTRGSLKSYWSAHFLTRYRSNPEALHRRLGRAGELTRRGLARCSHQWPRKPWKFGKTSDHTFRQALQIIGPPCTLPQKSALLMSITRSRRMYSMPAS